MNYKKLFYISLAILCFISGTYLILLQLNRQSSNIEEDENKQLISFHLSDIAAIAVIRKDIKYGIIQQGINLHIEPPIEDEVFSEQEFQAFVYDISHLLYTDIIKHPGNLSVYGLDDPLSQITVISNEGEKVRLILGKKNNVDNSYYLKKEDCPYLYLVSNETADLFLYKIEDFRERHVIPEIGMDSISVVESVSLAFPTDRRSDFSIVNADSEGFKLQQPIENTTDFETVLSDLLFPLLNLNSDHRYKSKEMTTDPGTEIAIVSMMIGEYIYKLEFYLKEDGAVYVRRIDSHGSPDFFYFKESPFNINSIRYMDFLDGSIYHCNISEIASINIHDFGENKEYTLEITGQSVNLRATMNETDVTYQSLMNFYHILVGTGISSRVKPALALKDMDNEDVIFQIEIEKKNGSIDILDFISSNRSEAFLSVNGVINFMTFNSLISEIRFELSQLAE